LLGKDRYLAAPQPDKHLQEQLVSRPFREWFKANSFNLGDRQTIA
jgi:hypothetical protein